MYEEFAANEMIWGLVLAGIYAGGLLAVFLIGLFGVCLKKRPLYFRLIVYAIGGYALEGIGFFVNSLCTSQFDYIDVSVISRFAYSIFLISASAGTLDSFLDDKAMKNARAQYLALIAPVLLTVSEAVYYILFAAYLSLFDTIIGCLLAAFKAVSIYFALKDLLLPPDELGFLKVIRPINIMILVEAGYEVISDYCGMFFPVTISITTILYVLVFFALIHSVLKGVKRWKSLV